ncbi:MAG: nucleotidyltransferase domain-containing protein [Dehalococcoidales bacterium]
MLETLFGSKLRVKALGWLFTHPDERFFVRQLTKILNEDSTNLSRELTRLEKTGIPVSTKEGRQKYYQPNRKSPVYDEIHRLIIKTAGVRDVLASALAPSMEKVEAAFIFGSFASGNEKSTSDIDLMIIGDIQFGEAVSLLSDAEGKLRREINPIVYTPVEFQKKNSEGHHFIKTLFDRDKIFIAGDDIELERLAGRRQIKTA